jgi:hypothetical protein
MIFAMADLFTGAGIVVSFDGENVSFVARRGSAPPLVLPAGAFVSAAAVGPKLELVGGFENDTKIALKLGPDAVAIANVLRQHLQLPRQPHRVSLDDIVGFDGQYVIVEGRVFPFANGPVMENRIDLLGVSGRIEHNAPYRVTGFYRRAAREQLRVLAIEHLNPPQTWFEGETVRLIFLPERQIIAFVPNPGHAFELPQGTVELLLPPDTIAYVTVDGATMTFHGDFSRTNYGSVIELAPISENDARAIFTLLDERFQIPRTPRVMAPAEAAALTTITLVTVEGAFRLGHIEGSNFDAGLQITGAPRLEANKRYRITGFLYPAIPTSDGPRFIGYHGPRLYPLTVTPA